VADTPSIIHVVPPMGDRGRSHGPWYDADGVFTAREAAFIESRAEGKTIKAAAASATPPFAYSTARRLDDREDVRSAIRKRVWDAVESGARALGQSSATAARTLKRVAIHGGPGDGPCVSAAKAILEISMRAIEVQEFGARLAAVEAVLGKTRS